MLGEPVCETVCVTEREKEGPAVMFIYWVGLRGRKQTFLIYTLPRKQRNSEGEAITASPVYYLSNEEHPPPLSLHVKYSLILNSLPPALFIVTLLTKLGIGH